MVCYSPKQSQSPKSRLHFGIAYRVLLLLHFQDGAILEGPFYNIRLFGSALNPLTGLQLSPELGEFGELDQVPDGAQRRIDDSRLGDCIGGWDRVGHFCGRR